MFRLSLGLIGVLIIILVQLVFELDPWWASKIGLAVVVIGVFIHAIATNGWDGDRSRK